MARLDCVPSDLTAILVTHEHADHLKGVAPLARKYRLPVYMTPGTFHVRSIGELPFLHMIEGYQPFYFDDLEIQPVAVPHDAREPAQFIFNVAGKRLGILTDLGTISPHVETFFSECDALLVEANHDLHMLTVGAYPASLKRRVGGAWGHLNNDQTASFLGRVNQEKLRHLVIGHISQQNNSIECARAVLDPVTADIQCVKYACQDQGFDWVDII